MADQVAQNSLLYVAGRKFSTRWTSQTLRLGREPQDGTRGGDDTRRNVPGIRTSAYECEFIQDWGTDLIEEEMAGATYDIASAPLIFTPPESTNLAGGKAFGMLATVGDYSVLDAAIGELLRGSVSARAGGATVYGTILSIGEKTATGNGAAFQVGAAVAGQKVYACIMAPTVSASDTVDCVIASDSQEDFLATPETRFTFDQISASGAYQWMEIDGPITDDWWRAELTIAGAAVSIDLIVLIAIQ